MGKRKADFEGRGTKKRRKNKNEGPAKISTSKMKKKIRDVLRLLKRENLPANVREEHERELSSVKKELQMAQKNNKQFRMAKKYQMVRFFEEKRKAVRRLRQAEKALDEENTPKNQAEVDKYTLDLYYTIHFPLTEKYIALYPKAPIESQRTLDKREKILQQLKEEMLQGGKKVSGSNNVQLGKRKKDVKGEEKSQSQSEEERNEGEEGEEEAEEDEYLQF